MVMTDQPLKRLGGVEAGAERVSSTAATTYRRVKEAAPPRVKDTISGVEERVSQAAAPYVAKAQVCGALRRPSRWQHLRC